MDIVVIPPTPEPPRLEEARATHPKEPIVDAEDLAKVIRTFDTETENIFQFFTEYI